MFGAVCLGRLRCGMLDQDLVLGPRSAQRPNAAAVNVLSQKTEAVNKQTVLYTFLILPSKTSRNMFSDHCSNIDLRPASSPRKYPVSLYIVRCSLQFQSLY